MKAINFVLLLMVLVDCGSFCFDAPYLCIGLSIVLVIVLLMRVMALPPDEADIEADVNTTLSDQPSSGYAVARTLLSPEAGITVTFNADADR
jgi:hypothetical protein